MFTKWSHVVRFMGDLLQMKKKVLCVVQCHQLQQPQKKHKKMACNDGYKYC